MHLPCSYFPNYFSVEDVLATQERTPCKFLKDVPKMGKLNQVTVDKDLKAGINLELPLWIVQEMASGRQPLVVPDLPKIYREVYREILKADASAVDLHKFNHYFYELGEYVKHFDHKGDVQGILVHTFKTRFKQLMDIADNSISDSSIQQKLDILERKMLNNAYIAKTKLNTWLIQSGSAIEMANMVINHKKRKRMTLDDNIT